MKKLTVNKAVFWNVGDKKMAGKVKQVMGDHVVVKAADADYIVNKSCLKTAPISRLASLTVIAALKDKKPEMLELEFDLNTGELKLTWLDEFDENGRMIGCSSDAYDPFIKEVDRIFVDGLEGTHKEWNQPPPPPPPPQVDKKLDIKKTPGKTIMGPGVAPAKPNVAPVKKKTII
jgi:hypothetical protein